MEIDAELMDEIAFYVVDDHDEEVAEILYNLYSKYAELAASNEEEVLGFYFWSRMVRGK